MENRGQTALEYLITYGWAILVILIVLAVLWYYGIFNPATWAGAQVVSSTSFQVLDSKMTNSTLSFSVGNKVGSSVTITALAISGNGLGGTATGLPLTVVANGNAALTIGTLTGATSGSTVTFTVTVTFDNLGVGGQTGKTETISFRNVKIP